jgi:hypothetical protein
MNRLLRRKIILSSIACSALFMSIYSLAADSEYEQWRKKTQTEFQNYLDENDKAFIGFLNKKCQEVDVEKRLHGTLRLNL